MTTYSTEYGPIYYDSSGNDHRANIVNFVAKFPKRHESVKLQKAALDAFHEAERRYAHRTLGKKLWRRFQSRAIVVTGSWRSFSLQQMLYREDPQRYANPYSSGHVQAIAIDVNTTNKDFQLQREILKNVGWKQARTDEPWHWSWGVEV